MPNHKTAVIGTTAWGITLGLINARMGRDVRVWARTRKEAKALTEKGLDQKKFPGQTAPPAMRFTSSLEETMAGVDAVILAVPAPSMRQNIAKVAPYLEKQTMVVSVAKGLETGSNKLMSTVIAEEIDVKLAGNICALSGPNLAREIMQDMPAAAVVAAASLDTARKAQKALTCPKFCIFTNTDIIGVELGGALKNILALGAGIADGLDYGDNAKSAYITRGLTEITALGMAIGANPLTFSGLAGLGDVIATCSSTLSRNHYVGMELAAGKRLEDIMAAMDEVAEGVNTVQAAYELSQQLGLEMPITEKIYRILYKGLSPVEAAAELMGGNAKHELVGKRWRLFSLFRGNSRRKTTPPNPEPPANP